jgi:hypothetical protein
MSESFGRLPTKATAMVAETLFVDDVLPPEGAYESRDYI